MKKALKIIYFFFIIILFTQPSTAQISLPYKIKVIDSLLVNYNFKNNQPGVSILVTQNNDIIYEKQFGMANIEDRIKIDSNSVFNIGSITKQFTAFCIYLLEEEGKINLNDSLQKYIPELPSFGKTITIKHLLSHTSGILNHLDYLINIGKYQEKYSIADGALAFYKKYPYLSSTPGDRFVYSNSGYMLLQIIIERISGLSITEFAKINIFEPLNMNSAQFVFNEKEALGDKMLSYSLKKSKFKPEKKPSPSALGATGVFCTLRDLAKWDANFYHNILGKKSQNIIQKMTTTFLFNNGEPTNYGGGLLLKTYKGNLVEEHSGGWNNFLSQHIRFPNEKLSIIVTTNTEEISPFQIADDIADLLIVNKIYQPTSFISLKKMTKRNFESVGSYRSYDNYIVELKYISDTLSITNYNDTSSRLAYIVQKLSSSDTSEIYMDSQGEKIELDIDSSNNIEGFYWDGNHYFKYKRYYEKTLENYNSSDREVKNISGKYSVKKLNLSFKIKKKLNGNYKIKPNLFIGFSLEKIAPNLFRIKDDTIYLLFEKGKLIISEKWMGDIELIKK